MNLVREKYISYLGENSRKGNHDFDFYRVFPDTNDIDKLIEQLDELKKCLDSFRPFNQSQVKNLNEYFDIEYTYNSNKIEGNTLTLQETMLVVTKGITIGGKNLDEHLEAINHQEAIDFIRKIAQNKVKFSEEIIKKIHSIIVSKISHLKKEEIGKYRKVEVRISGSPHIPPMAVNVPDEMNKLLDFYNEEIGKSHPVLLTSEMHERITTIHPFVDGNERTARLVMNLILLQNGYPITIISGEKENRDEYYYSLMVANVDDDKSRFHKLILKTVKQSFFEYLNLVSKNIDNTEQGTYFFEIIKDYIG